MAGAAMPHAGAAAEHMGAFGPYSMSREASGTSWQPDASPMIGPVTMSGPWMMMTHVLLNGVYDNQGGPRGGDMTFLNGMLMVMAQRPLGMGTLGLRAMLSPDPFMGKGGYPLLLAAGETANGVDLLVDRQHPHDLFMELSGSYSRRLSPNSSVFIYGGLPGEPAFGPPAFMHRLSTLDSPEAPITHHWFDSTHITFGVVTAGLVFNGLKFDASIFNGREPDQNRYDIETGPMKSWSIRASWNPTANWALQASFARLESPEALEPDVNDNRVSASVIYTRPFGANNLWSTTLAWGRKGLQPGPDLDAWALESAMMLGDHWTIFGRGERVDQNELSEDTDAVFSVGKISLGGIYDFRLTERWKLGLGGLVSAYDVPSDLTPPYGDPTSYMLFVRLKLSAPMAQ